MGWSRTRKSRIHGYATGSSARRGRGVAVGDLPTSSVSEPQLVPE